MHWTQTPAGRRKLAAIQQKRWAHQSKAKNGPSTTPVATYNTLKEAIARFDADLISLKTTLEGFKQFFGYEHD